MNFRATRKALLAEADTLLKKAETAGLTEAETARTVALRTEIETVEARIKADDEVRATLKAITGDVNDEDDAAPGLPFGGQRDDAFASSGSKAVAAATAAIRKAITGSKAATVSGSVTIPLSTGVIDMPRRARTVASLLTPAPLTPDPTGETSAAVSYLRQTTRTLAAATVARGAEKPKSSLGLTRETDALATVAHVLEGVPRQWLLDSRALGQFLESEMGYGVLLGLDDLVLNGGTDEDGEDVDGFLTATGVGAQAFDTDALTTVLAAFAALEDKGFIADGIALNPLDWAAIAGARATDGHFIVPGGPSAAPTRALFGVPVTTTAAITRGTALTGAFKGGNAALASSGTLDIAWSEARGFARNELDVRAEGRWALALARPSAFTVVSLTADQG